MNLRVKCFLVVLLIVTLLLPGCAAENQGSGEEPAKEIVIPSSLSPMDVVEKIYPENPMRFITGEFHERGAPLLADGACEEGFVGGYVEPFAERWYTKIGGTTLNQSSVYVVLRFAILKYESAEFAERSYESIAEAYDLQNSSYKGIAVKAGVKPTSEYGDESTWGVSNLSFYVVHSGCFIIFFHGREDIAQDALDKGIDTFGVEPSSS